MRFPLSFAQQRIWSAGRDAPVHLAYGIWLDGAVDHGTLQRALDAMIVRHPVLRTSIVATGGVPEQLVADQARVPIEAVSVADDGAAEAIAAGLASRPFDLARGPLLRAALIGVGAERWLFVLVLHQIISDDASMGILLTELSTVYKSAEPALDPLWMDYGDYAVWQRDRLRGEELERQLGHWRERLRDAPRALLGQAHRGARATATIDATATQGRDDAAFLAGFAVVVSRCTRRTGLVIGIPVSGRIRVELEPIVGPFADLVPLRVSLAGNPTFAELLERVRAATAEALAHGELPYEKLTEEFGPLIRIQFAQLPAAPAMDLPGVTARGQILFTGTARCDLSLIVRDSALTLEYGTNLVEAPVADWLVASVAGVLECAAAAPDTLLADLPLPPLANPADEPDVRRALLASMSTRTAATETVPMPAVCDRAARLARVLAAHGVGPETRVGGCVGRGVGMMTALLGVWWAGGAYVPLDPDFPLARLATMAHDAGLRLVVSDGDHAGLAGSVADGVTVIMVDELAAEPLDPVPVPADALAYTIFTSDPTGRPTGVDIGHRAVASLLAALRSEFGPGAELAIATAGQTPDAAPGNLYGCTETTVWSAIRVGLVDVGPALDGARLYLLDDQLTPVPAGVVGEVYVAGRGVARGYHGRPGRTARSFLPDPWTFEPGARMYATGDLGRWRAGGGLTLVGRTDHRVTIKGFRVECGEVEAVLLAHPAVRQAVVISSPNAGEPTLVAYVVPHPGGVAARPGAELLTLLRPHLRARLPEYMIPALVVTLPALPLTRGGQVDRTALPAPGWADRPAAGPVPPRDPVEATMVRIWGELLRTPTPIGVHDSLSGFGVTSLTAIRFVARIADTYGVNLPAHHVLATPTVAELARILRADPDFGPAEDPAHDDELAELSDEELDDLLRAALAARTRRQAARGERA